MSVPLEQTRSPQQLMITIDGYQFHSILYDGSTSMVYRGVHIANREPVVLKVLKPETITSQARTRYRQEYDITRMLHQRGHLPGVIRAYGLEEQQGILAIALEDFGGISLRDAMQSALG
ncbi:MAG: hypothetical protein F6K30_22415, partial [Cyanothece sp. SIO2G6]|nr:hypothetical protein [Cyanothece sp. SIO2G6]